jgi:hypothetical protein
MSISKGRLKRYLWMGGVTLVLLLSISGCGIIGGEEPTAALISPPTETDTPDPSPTNTATITPTPTRQGLPSATSRPTLRPSWTPLPSRTLRPTWTASPTLSPTATEPVGILLEENFDDPLNPWLDREGGNWAMGNAGKKYFMSVFAPKVEITSARTWLKLDEVRIEADITHNNGRGYYGFHCRESPGGNYYTAFITTDGTYGFGENRNDKLTVIESGPLPELDPPIEVRRATNHVRVDCRGNAITLYINDIAIDRTTIPGLGVGYVGMMIGTRFEDKRELTVYYDNLVIYAPVKTNE